LKHLFNIENKIDEKNHQKLSLIFGENYACFSITDKSGDNLYRLAYCSTDGWAEPELTNFYLTYPEFKDSFYQVIVAYDSNMSTLVPVNEYKYEDAGLYLRAFSGLNDSVSVISEAITEWQIYNIYAVSSDIHKWVNEKFPAARFWHLYSINIKSGQAGTDDFLYVDFQNERFIITFFSKGKLLLVQSFEYFTPGDVLYYLLKTCSQFSITQQDVYLKLSGLIDKDSALFKELYQYFLRVEFNNANWGKSNEYPAHYFTALNDLAKCVL
jgi:hypothetical protein